MTHHVDRFYAAVSVLAGDGHMKQRLIKAYQENLGDIAEDDLPRPQVRDVVLLVGRPGDDAERDAATVEIQALTGHRIEDDRRTVAGRGPAQLASVAVERHQQHGHEAPAARVLDQEGVHVREQVGERAGLLRAAAQHAARGRHEHRRGNAVAGDVADGRDLGDTTTLADPGVVSAIAEGAADNDED